MGPNSLSYHRSHVATLTTILLTLHLLTRGDFSLRRASARPSALAIQGMWLRGPSGAGNLAWQSCLQPPFRRLFGPGPTSSSGRRDFVGLVSFVRSQAQEIRQAPRKPAESRLHGRKPRPSGSPGLRRGRQFAHQTNCGKGVLGEVFIPFHGPKAHADSQDWLPHEEANRQAHAPALILTSGTRRGPF